MTIGCHLVNYFCEVCEQMATFENGSCCFCKRRATAQNNLSKKIEFNNLSTDEKLYRKPNINY